MDFFETRAKWSCTRRPGVAGGAILFSSPGLENRCSFDRIAGDQIKR